MLSPTTSAPKTKEKVRRVRFLNLQKLMEPQKQEYLDAFERVTKNTQFIRGDELVAFEKEFGSWIGPHCTAVGCGNGTDAIRLAARALNLAPGSEVIVPAMTFFASVEPLVELGLNVKLVDVSEGTWLIDTEKLRASVSKNTKLIVPVHLYGQMANMEEIREIADSVGAKVLEDSAQAHGATWNGKPVGFFGDVATYSFFPGKNLGAFGDAGAVVSRDKEIVKTVKGLGDHGGLVKYQHDEMGYNSRLDNLQAAFLRIKLKHIDTWNTRRREVAKLYHELLSDLPYLTLPVEHIKAKSVYHLFVVLVQDRNGFRDFLAENGVDTGIHYPKAIHEQPAFTKHFGKTESFPNAEKVGAHGVSLPMCPTLSDAEVQYVSEVIHKYFEKK